jgi:hypothetical protein
MGGHIKLRLLLFGVQATGNDMKKKFIVFLCGVFLTMLVVNVERGQIGDYLEKLTN